MLYISIFCCCWVCLKSPPDLLSFPCNFSAVLQKNGRKRKISLPFGDSCSSKVPDASGRISFSIMDDFLENQGHSVQTSLFLYQYIYFFCGSPYHYSVPFSYLHRNVGDCFAIQKYHKVNQSIYFCFFRHPFLPKVHQINICPNQIEKVFFLSLVCL